MNENVCIAKKRQTRLRRDENEDVSLLRINIWQKKNMYVNVKYIGNETSVSKLDEK